MKLKYTQSISKYILEELLVLNYVNTIYISIISQCFETIKNALMNMYFTIFLQWILLSNFFIFVNITDEDISFLFSLNSECS